MAKGRKTGGRQKGTVNKVTADIRAAIEGAFTDLGGEAWLVTLAKENPKAFATLLAKLMPTVIEGELDLSVGLAERLARARKRAAGAPADA